MFKSLTDQDHSPNHKNKTEILLRCNQLSLLIHIFDSINLSRKTSSYEHTIFVADREEEISLQAIESIRAVYYRISVLTLLHDLHIT